MRATVVAIPSSCVKRLVMPIMRWGVYVIFFIVFLFAAGCTKTDLGFVRYNTPASGEAFFSLPRGANDTVQKIVLLLRNYNDKHDFVSSLPANAGLPVWEKLMIKREANSVARNDGDSAEIIYIPLTSNNENLSSDHYEFKYKRYRTLQIEQRAIAQCDPTYDSIARLNLDHYVNLPVDSFLRLIPASYNDIGFIRNTRGYRTRGLSIRYPSGMNIVINPLKYKFMNPVDPGKVWNLDLFKKERAGSIIVHHPNLPTLYGQVD